MRTPLILMAIAFTLSSCATAQRNGITKPYQSTRPANTELIHIPVRENGVIGTLVVPDTARAYPGVLRLGGAEGGISLGDAETIASEGYAVFAIAYFGVEGLPGDLEEVPLEYFGKAIALMKSSPHIDSTKLAVVGISRGSTLALLLPTIYDDFDAVVAIAPSHVNWQATYLDWGHYADRSSFTSGGKALPYVPYDFSNKAAMEGCNAEIGACVTMYENSLKQHERVREATIPVEQIRAPILLFSGKADSMWPSSAMGDLVMQRLNQAQFPLEHRHIAYDNAGHCGINRCYDHAALDGNQAAIEDMRRQLVQFLDRYLRSKQETRP